MPLLTTGVDLVFAPPAKKPPVANNDSGFITAKNTPLLLLASALLGNNTDPNGYSLSFAGAAKPTNGYCPYNASTQAVTFVPTTNYTGGGKLHLHHHESGRRLTATGDVSLTVSATASTRGLFSASAVTVPSEVNLDDDTQLGVRFQSSAAGTITGLSFYKVAQNTLGKQQRLPKKT
jgi:hypothetical protein